MPDYEAKLIAEAERLMRSKFGRSKKLFVQRNTGTPGMGGIFSVYRNITRSGEIMSATLVGSVHV